MNAKTLEQRVAALEQELSDLKAKMQGPFKPWWEQIWGSFAGDPAFLEAMPYGREYRQAERDRRKRRLS